MRVQGILDGKLVQPELRLQGAQILLSRLMHADPNEVALLTGPGGALAELDLGDSLPAAVRKGGDHPTHRQLLALPGRPGYHGRTIIGCRAASQPCPRSAPACSCTAPRRPARRS